MSLFMILNLFFLLNPTISHMWSFDEGIGNIIHNNTTGFIHFDMKFGNTSTPQWVLGRDSGYALKFDGIDDYISNPGLLKVSKADGSVSFWFKVDKEINYTNKKVWDFIVTQNTIVGDYTTVRDRIYQFTPDDYMVISMSGYDWYCDPGELVFAIKNTNFSYVCSSTSRWLGGVWYNINATWGRGGMKLFVDDALENSSVFSGVWDSGFATDFFVGGYPVINEFYGNFTIDELKITYDTY